MDPSSSYRFDIFQIYREFSDIKSVNALNCGEAGYRQDHESKKVMSREALAQLLKLAELRVHTRISIFDELYLLMTQLDLMADFSEFSRFYDFVFFMCRENCQKNISVERAVTAWRLVLTGRFRLLNQWCDFVEKNQRHNISEDTWRQVLAFSRCVHENLEGYDSEGAWPVLIDDFVEHMYRASGSNEKSNLLCNCGESESQSWLFEDPLPGLRTFPGLKRKLPKDLQQDGVESCNALLEKCMNLNPVYNFKRSRQIAYGPVNLEDNPLGDTADDCMEITKHSSPLSSSKSPCAVERCLLKGFEGLFSTRSYLQLEKKRRVFHIV